MWVDILIGIFSLICVSAICFLFYIGARIFLGMFEMFMYMITLGQYNPNYKETKKELKGKRLNNVKHPVLF